MKTPLMLKSDCIRRSVQRNDMHYIEIFLQEHPVIAGTILAFITSLMRLWNKSLSWCNKIIDSMLCMSLTVGIFYGLNYITPLDPNVALCIGSFVGYLGTEQIKTIILRTVELKTNGGIQDHADDK